MALATGAQALLTYIREVTWGTTPGTPAMTVLPVSAAFVCLFWLIEQRYYLVPFALLFALRTTEDRRAEVLTLTLWIPVALAFLHGMVNFEFFL